MMLIRFGSTIEDYRKFLEVRRLPRYRFRGSAAVIPDEFAARFGGSSVGTTQSPVIHRDAFDYQRAITEMAIRKKKYAVFADCGLGKTLILLDFARHAVHATGRRVLIVSPLMVIRQTCAEYARFYGTDDAPQIVPAADLGRWLADGDGIGITNFEAIRDDLPSAALGGLILDESSMLKSHYGAWGTRLIEMGRGVEYKLCCTGTPAPNDRIEYANHAVFLDAARTVNEFLARYFINRGETSNRWELKPHALRPFYRDLSTWCIFLTNPATYGWRDNCGTLPPVEVHVEDVPLTYEQREAATALTGRLVPSIGSGKLGERQALGRIAKGGVVRSHKADYIRARIASWQDESTIVWCAYNAEQDAMSAAMPRAASMYGATTPDIRQLMLDEFLRRQQLVLITKPKILGFGLNLQVCTRQVFAGLRDSYEEYYQAYKRSNRVGSTETLHIHIPVTELEYPFVENVLRKADRVKYDTEEQEILFRQLGGYA